LYARKASDSQAQKKKKKEMR